MHCETDKQQASVLSSHCYIYYHPLPVPYIFRTNLPGKPIYQATIDPWFQEFIGNWKMRDHQPPGFLLHRNCVSCATCWFVFVCCPSSAYPEKVSMTHGGGGIIAYFKKTHRGHKPICCVSEKMTISFRPLGWYPSPRFNTFPWQSPHVDDDWNVQNVSGIFMLWSKYNRVTGNVSICTVYRTSCVYTNTVDHLCRYGDVSKQYNNLKLPRKTTSQSKNNHLNMYFLLKTVIFHLSS